MGQLTVGWDVDLVWEFWDVDLKSFLDVIQDLGVSLVWHERDGQTLGTESACSGHLHQTGTHYTAVNMFMEKSTKKTMILLNKFFIIITFITSKDDLLLNSLDINNTHEDGKSTPHC